MYISISSSKLKNRFDQEFVGLISDVNVAKEIVSNLEEGELSVHDLVNLNKMCMRSGLDMLRTYRLDLFRTFNVGKLITTRSFINSWQIDFMIRAGHAHSSTAFYEINESFDDVYHTCMIIEDLNVISLISNQALHYFYVYVNCLTRSGVKAVSICDIWNVIDERS